MIVRNGMSRSIGVAQLMMQCGMFVPAASLRENVCDGIFTHYKREEEASMKSGKLDEELDRMSVIADVITVHALLPCNESFAATNDREGSDIARQVIRALIEAGVKVFFVTHLYDFAHGFYLQGLDTTLFLRAERQSDGRRTFQTQRGRAAANELWRRLLSAYLWSSPILIDENIYR